MRLERREGVPPARVVVDEDIAGEEGDIDGVAAPVDVVVGDDHVRAAPRADSAPPGEEGGRVVHPTACDEAAHRVVVPDRVLLDVQELEPASVAANAEREVHSCVPDGCAVAVLDLPAADDAASENGVYPGHGRGDGGDGAVIVCEWVVKREDVRRLRADAVDLV